MKIYPLRPFIRSLLLLISALPFFAVAETLTQFTTRCESDLELPTNSITGFDCSLGTLLPTSKFGAACDAQALLGGVGCIANSRLGVKSFTNADVKAVWVCRKYVGVDNTADSRYHDVAMIVHNRKNGKTCFFQNNLDSTSDGPTIPGPKDSSASLVWDTPANTAGINCIRCHVNDPYIVTPHVADAFNSSRLVRFNPKGAYSVVGLDFASLNSQISRVEGCGGLCHFNPNSSFVSDALTKHWMIPGTLASYLPFNFNPISGQFYSLQTNGGILGFNGEGGGTCNGSSCPHWSLLDNNSSTVKVAASGSKLFQMHNTGLIWEFMGAQCSQTNSCPSWRMIDNNSNTSQIVSGNGIAYQMWYSGAIWRYTGTPCSGSNCPGWQLLDNNSATTEIVASGGSLYQRHKNGAVWKYTGTPCSGNACPGWQLIANDSRTINLVAGGSSIYMHQKSGAVWKYTGTPCSSSSVCNGWQLVDYDNANTKQVVAGSSSLYRLHYNGEIWRYSGSGQTWVMLDNNPNASEIAASSNGLLQRHSSGVVWRFTGTVCSGSSCPGWTPIENFTNTKTIVGARL
ncbi:MAG: hypothetical protein EOO52_15165 [Gammaproteobacteria bacterium]|nr:MAG: hypothetical protein EOO52_15165 [Gammaproteobacteria bacterium]